MLQKLPKASDTNKFFKMT